MTSHSLFDPGNDKECLKEYAFEYKITLSKLGKLVIKRTKGKENTKGHLPDSHYNLCIYP